MVTLHCSSLAKELFKHHMILEVKIEFTFPKENAMDLTAIPIEHDQMRAKKS